MHTKLPNLKEGASLYTNSSVRHKKGEVGKDSKGLCPLAQVSLTLSELDCYTIGRLLH